MFLAIKEIKKEKTRFIMIILITVLISYLVYFLSSLAYGLAQINRTAVDYWNAEGIVLSKTANENIYASSIDEDIIIKSGLNLKDAINISSQSIYIVQEPDDTPTDVVFLGYDFENESIVPPIVEGRLPSSDHEAVISNNLKETVDVNVDDTVEISKTGREFKVVGFTSDSNYNTAPVIYINQRMASQAMMMYSTNDKSVDASSTPTPNMPNRFSAVVLRDNINESLLTSNDLALLTTNDFINNIPGYQAQIATFGLMIVSLAFISSVIIGIFMYILTTQKKSIFAILKIQGYQDAFIIKSVMTQSIILIVSGFSIGFLLTMITIKLMPAQVPVAVNVPLFVGVSTFSLVCAFLGTLLSARSILKIDPLEAL